MGTTIEVTLDGETSVTTRSITDPDRFVCDLYPAVLERPAALAVGSTELFRVRMAQYTTEPTAIARLVLDLADSAVPEVEQAPGIVRIRLGPARAADGTRHEPAARVPVPEAAISRSEPAPGDPSSALTTLATPDEPPAPPPAGPAAASGEAAGGAPGIAGVSVIEPLLVPAAISAPAVAPAPALEPAADEAPPSHGLVTRWGERLKTQGPWRREGDRILYTNDAGNLVSIRVSEVDLEASRKPQPESAGSAAPATPGPEPKAAVLVLDDLPSIEEEADPTSTGEAKTGEEQPGQGAADSEPREPEPPRAHR